MENLTFLEFFSVVIGLTWLFLIVATSILTNKARLLKRGYKTEYIEYTRKDIFKRNVGIAIVMPLLGVIATLVIWLFVDDINEFQNMIYIALLWIVLIIPFPILDMRKTNKKYKELAIETNSDIVIDFNYNILHLMFKPNLELVIAFLYVAYFIFYIESFHVSFIHLFLLWALYSVGRYSKFSIAPQLKDGYLYLFIFIMINQALLIFHLVREIQIKLTCTECYSTLGYYMGISLSAILLFKFIFYLFQFPQIRLKTRNIQQKL